MPVWGVGRCLVGRSIPVSTTFDSTAHFAAPRMDFIVIITAMPKASLLTFGALSFYW